MVCPRKFKICFVMLRFRLLRYNFAKGHNHANFVRLEIVYSGHWVTCAIYCPVLLKRVQVCFVDKQVPELEAASAEYIDVAFTVGLKFGRKSTFCWLYLSRLFLCSPPVCTCAHDLKIFEHMHTAKKCVPPYLK